MSTDISSNPRGWESQMKEITTSYTICLNEDDLSKFISRWTPNRTINLKSGKEISDDLTNAFKSDADDIKKRHEAIAKRATDETQKFEKETEHIKNVEERRAAVQKKINAQVDQSKAEVAQGWEDYRVKTLERMNAQPIEQAERGVEVWTLVVTTFTKFWKEAQKILFEAMNAVVALVAKVWEGVQTAFIKAKEWVVKGWQAVLDLF